VYDIAVIGAGPAGLAAAFRISALQPDAAVVLIDKTAPWEHPIACAEGVGRLGFHEALEVRPEWIRAQVGKASFHSPNNSVVTYSDPNKGGYIIDRSRMQKDLAEACRERGVCCLLQHRVSDVSPADSQGRRTVTLANHAPLQARVVIDCSGPLSRIGRSDGMAWKPLDLEPAFFAHVHGIACETDAVHIYMHAGFAPGGYAWSFPRDNQSANVGIVVGSGFRAAVNIRTQLDAFVKHHFAGGKIERCFAGTIPCFRTRQPMAVPGLLKAGDAASTINPISRAGIVEALMCGRLAGEKALAMLGADSERGLRKICKEYEKAWFVKRSKSHLKLAKVKASLAAIADAEFNAAAETLGQIPIASLTMSKIFRISLGRFPRLVWAMRHLM
jgi:geranylgeranyl reductase family protein